MENISIPASTPPVEQTDLANEAGQQQQNGEKSSEEQGGQELMPKDAAIILRIMRALHINSYEPSVVDQLLQFVHRYASSVIDESTRHAMHAGHKRVEADDLRLGTFMTLEMAYTPQPPKEALLELARNRPNHAIPPYHANGRTGMIARLKHSHYENCKLRARQQRKVMTRSAVIRREEPRPLATNPAIRRLDIFNLVLIRRGKRTVIQRVSPLDIQRSCTYRDPPNASDEEDNGKDKNVTREKRANVTRDQPANEDEDDCEGVEVYELEKPDGADDELKIGKRVPQMPVQKPDVEQLIPCIGKESMVESRDPSIPQQQQQPEQQQEQQQQEPQPGTSRGTNNGVPYVAHKRLTYKYNDDSDSE